MLNQDFCEALECRISQALDNSSDVNVKGFWCDGVLLLESEKYYSQKFINDNRETKMKAFVGKDGQTVYDLILKFGRKAVSKYVRQLDIVDCIPEARFKNWFSIDVSTKKIQIYLD